MNVFIIFFSDSAFGYGEGKKRYTVNDADLQVRLYPRHVSNVLGMDSASFQNLNLYSLKPEVLKDTKRLQK